MFLPKHDVEIVDCVCVDENIANMNKLYLDISGIGFIKRLRLSLPLVLCIIHAFQPTYCGRYDKRNQNEPHMEIPNYPLS